MFAQDAESRPPRNRDETAESQQPVLRRGWCQSHLGREALHSGRGPRISMEKELQTQSRQRGSSPHRLWAPWWGWTASCLSPGQEVTQGSELEHAALGFMLDGAPGAFLFAAAVQHRAQGKRYNMDRKQADAQVDKKDSVTHYSPG